MRHLAQARNPYSRWWLWIPGSRVSLAPRNDVSASPRHMRGDREPAAVLPRPAVGVTSRSRLPVLCRVACSRMDDRKIAHHANLDVMRLEIFDRHRHRRLLEKAGAVDQRLVGIGAIEILGKNFVEPLHVGILHGGDIVSIKHRQLLDVFAHDFSSSNPPYPGSIRCMMRSR